MSRVNMIPTKMEEDIENIEPATNGGSQSSEECIIENSNSSTEETSPDTKKNIKIKPFAESKDLEKYLKKYDEFEERDNYTLDNINVPEKIILVVDRAHDEDCTNFIVGNVMYTPMVMLQKCLHLFVQLKHSINENHEFALVLLNQNNATWVLDFTKDVRKIHNALEKITLCNVEDTFDMDLVFKEILPHVKILNEDIVPSYITRSIIFYGRSYTIPKIKFCNEVKDLLSNKFFICDVLMTHESVDNSNHCSKIFECLQNMDLKGLSYFIPVGRSTLRLHNCMAKLLGHGLQRPLQKFQKI